MKILAIIPARYGSTRFPGKPLADIMGKPMIQRVYEQVQKTKKIDHSVVATDDERIFQAVIAFGGNAVMTSEKHPSGTDRCFEALQKTTGKFDALINIQGDEPFIDPEQIDQLAELITQKQVDIATLISPITDESLLFDSNVVKVVISKTGKALYFSRQTIPFNRNISKELWLTEHAYFRHLGIYAYKAEVLETLTKLVPSGLEKTESLEQLRWLENDLYIQAGITEKESFSIDTIDDLKKIIGKI
ncbi:MAG: 3-deoxy-manno-octulosonate cytidylyltransferase [Bacteroidales bacterium]|nr:3-deoxy-manno-octulosonate cytidylyltransferase [Bacteroidales bacterium]